MTEQRGLRDRKKQDTREAIAETARRLFSEHGFDAVTVADVAHAAGVSRKTVFNYFPTKEDLVYWRLETFEAALLAAVRDRAPGESYLAAFGRFVLAPRGVLARQDPEAIGELAALARTLTESQALRERERQIHERYTASLAALIAEEAEADTAAVGPWVAANALMGVHRALVDYARGRIVAGARNPRLAREVRAEGEQALALLERELGQFGARTVKADGKRRVAPRRRRRA